jgi:bifunctional UDP-N-acetylglucosamine pyrophosphorylase/glucosamine-1-phosphate N-acetyltransferase
MKSELPKVLHEVCGRPMLEYVLDTARAAGAGRLIVVVGHRADLVRGPLSDRSDVAFALQEEQKGTGHAVMMCRDLLRDHDGPVLVLAGDTPLLRSESLAGLLGEQQQERAACVVATATTDANNGLGRVVRGTGGEFLRIVEDKDATPAEKMIREINTGCYAFDCKALFDALAKVRPNNRQSEYYLTDCVEILKQDGRKVIAANRLDIVEALGINTRAQLAEVGRVLQDRFKVQLMLDGVTIVAPESTYIDLRAKVGADTVIHPFTTVGAAVIGRDCRIGPHAHIEADANVPDGTVVGPFEIAGG